MGLLYPNDSGFDLTRIFSADHARCIDTHKSTSGGIQFLGDKLVSWMLKKQNCTAMSSAKAEYVALSASCAQVMWMRTQLQDYGFNYNKNNVVVRLGINPMIQPEPGDLPKDNPKLEIAVLRGSYALSWKPCQGDSSKLNLPDHRYKRRCCSLTPAELDSLPHAHAQATKTYYKHQDSRIKKAQELKTKTSATLIFKIFLKDIKIIKTKIVKGDC
ncbi:hypothetical protein Tco_0693091 [Tanacetum coccineum]